MSKLVITLPKPSAHWHPAGCGCKPGRPYIRVSKVGKRTELISPDLQLREIEKYARANNIRLLDPVCDIDRSGRTFRKRSVDGIIAEIKKGDYQYVLLWKWSRWARNQEESAVYLGRVEEAGGTVISATEPFDRSTAGGRLQHGVTMQFDQYTSDLMSETWHGVHDMRREAGLPHSGRPRFGYDYVGKKFEINENTGPLLRHCYELIERGESMRAVLRYLQSTGVRTTFGGEWTVQGVTRMMDTGFAAGLIRGQSKPKQATSNSILAYDVWLPGSHEPLISIETWNAYKSRRVSLARMPVLSRGPAHALSRLLFCTECRRRLVIRYTGKTNTRQWTCLYQSTFHPGVPVSVNDGLALAAVRAWVKRDVGTDRLDVDTYAARLAEELKLGERKRRSQKAQLEEKIEKLGRLIDKALRVVMESEGEVEERAQRMLDGYSAEMKQLKAQQEVAEKKRRPAKKREQEKLQTLDRLWDDLARVPADLHRAISDLISRVEVGPRSVSSSRKSASDRVLPVPIWESPELEDWLESRPK